MKKLLILAALLTSGCFTSASEAQRAAEISGFVGVTTGGLAPFTCGEHDYIGRHFTGYNNGNGKPVKGTVCCGFLKGCTVRF